MLPTLFTTRYVTPLREGGSLPAIVEADDDGLYVIKLRGAGQGVKALIAELIAGELGHALGLRVPRLALMELDGALARTEPDPEIQDLLKASIGLNVGLDYLPGSVTFDPVVGPAPGAAAASAIVWFDAFITNIDRTPKNPNLLSWHKELWLIDHGAALYFHHAWDNPLERAKNAFPAVRDHILLPWASELAQVAPVLSAKVTPGLIDKILAAIPDSFLLSEPRFATAELHRAAYRDFLLARLEASPVFVTEALRARSALL